MIISKIYFLPKPASPRNKPNKIYMITPQINISNITTIVAQKQFFATRGVEKSKANKK